MRIFLAVHPGEQLVQELSTILDPWRSRLSVRWTRPQTWHLTLQFLGDWPQQRITRLKSGLQAMEPIPPFTTRPTGLGAFPNLRSPRVLFLHMDSDGQMAKLAHRIRATVNDSWPDGPQDNKPFREHLTVARVRQRLSRDQSKLLKEMDLSGLSPVTVADFRLVASDLRPDGPRYEELGVFPLEQP